MSPLAPPILCLVTDRHRLAGSAFGGDDGIGAVLRQIAAAVRAGIELVQVRERDLSSRDLAALVDRAVEIARGTPSRILVNDRVDIALACGAAGVHLRGDSMRAAAARSLVPPSFLVGRSVHDEGGASVASAEGGLDYLIVGSVFPTSSKPRRPPLGAATLKRIVDGVSVPVLAIGGVGAETIDEVVDAGAAGVAGIGMFVPPAGTADPGAALREVATLARRRFDRSRIRTAAGRR